MLMPKRVKRRKQFRGSMAGKALRGNKISNGEFGLVATEPCWIKSNQIEAARIAMTRYIKRGGKVWIKIFPDKPVTAKPAETRMGSGKGALEYWVAVVKPGRVMFEMCIRDRINNPAVLLADEPTGNLDRQNADEIMWLLEQINARGTTVIVVTHSQEIVDSMKKRVITMDKGMVVSDKRDGEIYEIQHNLL